MTRLVLASANLHKLREIEPLLSGSAVRLVPVTDLVAGWQIDETSDTLAGNARLKARAAVDSTGLPSVADDTGLFVDALGGLPGIRSARYAGHAADYNDNIGKLLAALSGCLSEERAARFETVVILAAADGRERRFEGVLKGAILDRRRGTGGFGYDPVFLPAGHDRTLAQMKFEEKNRVSHRARAFMALGRFLAAEPDWLARPAAV